MNIEVLKDIREELKELRLLYKELAEKLIPVEEPTAEEKKEKLAQKPQSDSNFEALAL